MDYLIVGAGLFGAVCARELTDAGKKVRVIEKRPYVGGMMHEDIRDGIRTGSHGGHIFHTNNRELWNYINRFGEFRQYRHQVWAMAEGKAYSMPISLSTMQQAEIRQIKPAGYETESVEGWCLNYVGQRLYQLLIKGYTEKQWGRPCRELPASIIKRLPVRHTWNTEYFSDAYQGMPTQGYTPIIEAMLRGIDVELGKKFIGESTATKIIYTGAVDELFGYRYGRLEYRSLYFDHARLEVPDYQGCATMNYCDANVPFTRIIEWKHFFPYSSDYTWIMREYPMRYDGLNEPYYPINDARNNSIYLRYQEATPKEILLGGRMGSYHYADMHQTIAAALKLVQKELS